MRVTILHRAAEGSLAGGFKVLTDYAQALTDAGHEVTLVSPSRSEPRFGGLLGRLPLEKRARGRDDFVRGRSFASVVLDEDRPVRASDLPDADVVIASWFECVEWMLALPPSKGAKVHFVQDYERFAHLPQARAKAVLDADVPKVCVSSWIADRLRAEHGGRVAAVVPNGVDTDAFPFAPRSRGRPIRVGFLHASTERKRVSLAYDALRVMRDRGVAFEAFAFGKGDATPAQATLLKDYHRAPPQAAIPGLYAAADAWLFTSRTEGFGLPILEAMASGTPVVATRAGAAEDLVTERNGALVDGDPDAVADAVFRLAEIDGAAWREVSAAARRTAEANDLTAAARRFEAAITAIVDDTRSVYTNA